MRLRDRMKAAAHRAAMPLSRTSISTDPSRIRNVLAKTITLNWTHEGQGRVVRTGRYNAGSPSEVIPHDVYALSSRTTKHSKPPTGFYRGRYR